jgi:hypothetical protein
VIEHVADHGHAATHPLPATSQFWMVKLRHSAVAAYQRLQQRLHRVGTDGVALSQFVNCCHDSADRFPAPRRARSSRALTTSAGSRLRSASPPGLALGRCFGRRSRSSPRRTSCTFRLKKRRCAVSSARPTTVMLRGWGAGCEARAGKGASNRERKPVQRGDLRRGRPSRGPASLMRPVEDRARRNVPFFAAMLGTERKTQQSSRLSDPVESCATSVSQSVQQKSWAGGLKSQGAEGRKTSSLVRIMH